MAKNDDFCKTSDQIITMGANRYRRTDRGSLVLVGPKAAYLSGETRIIPGINVMGGSGPMSQLPYSARHAMARTRGRR